MMSSTVLRRGLRAAASTVAACRASSNVLPARSAVTEIGASYHTAAAWRSRAACGATATSVGGKNAPAQLFGGACGTSIFGGAGESVVGRVAPGAAALPFALQMLRRDFSSSSTAAGGREKVAPGDVLEALIGNSKAIAIREELEALAQTKTHVSYAEFSEIVGEASGGGEKKEKDIATVCQTLQDAGVIMKLEDVVYLNPSQLTRDLLKVLPAVPSAVYGVSAEELEVMEGELEAMQSEVEKAAARASFNSNVIVGTGLLLLCTQLAVFIRLTYVELSWDVMEPISYFVGVFNAILVYIYFMLYKRDFSFDDWSSRLHSHFHEKNIESKGINYARYKHLVKKLRK